MNALSLVAVAGPFADGRPALQRLCAGAPMLLTAEEVDLVALVNRADAIIGTLLHNLRACLDYCTWQAADETARTSNPTAIQLP